MENKLSREAIGRLIEDLKRDGEWPPVSFDAFIDDWIGWIPVSERDKFCLQVRNLADRQPPAAAKEPK